MLKLLKKTPDLTGVEKELYEEKDAYDPDFVDDPTAYAFSYLLQNCADAVCLLPLEEAQKRIQEKVESARSHVNNDPEWMAESAHIYPDEYIFWY